MEGIWFNDKTPRRIKLRSATSLVGKAPTKQKRIKAMWTMNLDSGGEDQIANLPEWLERDRDFVMKNGQTITAAQVVHEVNMIFSDANLFKKTPTEAPKTQIDHFQIKRMGEADDPDTVVTFETRTQFSTDLWNWLGQQSGEEFDVEFETLNLAEQSVSADGQLTLSGEPVAVNPSDEDEADASEGEEDYEAARAEACKPEHDSEFGAAAKKIDAHLQKEKKSKFKNPTPREVADAKHKLAVM